MLRKCRNKVKICLLEYKKKKTMRDEFVYLDIFLFFFFLTVFQLMYWQLIEFLYLKSGCLFEAGSLFNFKRFRQVASSFYNKK